VEGTSDHEGQSGILSELHYLARMTGATVFVLHHASESNGQDPLKAPPQSAIQNKTSHYPGPDFDGGVGFADRELPGGCGEGAVWSE